MATASVKEALACGQCLSRCQFIGARAVLKNHLVYLCANRKRQGSGMARFSLVRT